jgi:predicted nuclease of predicted toxin-antitoxin system
MWLLDANMPVQLVGLLRELGIEAESAVARGWNTLSNGSLVSAAARAEFTVLLTRDRLFGESAAGALKTNSEFCVVRVVCHSFVLMRSFMSSVRLGMKRESLPCRAG